MVSMCLSAPFEGAISIMYCINKEGKHLYMVLNELHVASTGHFIHCFVYVACMHF